MCACQGLRATVSADGFGQELQGYIKVTVLSCHTSALVQSFAYLDIRFFRFGWFFHDKGVWNSQKKPENQ